jgi:hypothetical protein
MVHNIFLQIKYYLYTGLIYLNYRSQTMKSLISILIMLLASSVMAQSPNYLGYTFKNLTFFDQGEDSSAIVYEDSAFQIVDFTLGLGDDWIFGAVLDLNQDQERSRNIMVQLGYGDWGASIETGKISGRFATDSDLYYQPTQGDFEYDYEGYKIFSYDSWNSKSGFSYSKWTQPSVVVVSLDWNDSACATRVCELSWVDPEVEYTLYGWYMTNLLMERLTEGSKYINGINFEAISELGFMTIESSGANISRASNVTDQPVKNESTSGFAARSTFQVGYYGGEKINDTTGFSWGVGYELNFTGMILGGRSTVDDDYVTTPSQYIIGHGPYVKIMVRI